MAGTQTVTILFTDLVESTRLSSRLDPSRADDLRKSHFEVLREAIAATGGREVKNLGDGLMVSFGGPRGAVDCAVAMQQAIKRQNRQHAMSLAIRVGVALGEATLEDGDWFGEPVTQAAGLCAVAAGDQILVAEAVRVVSGRHHGHEFVAVGERSLKGLHDPVLTFEVRWSPSAAHSVTLPPRLATPPEVGLVGRQSALESLGSVFKSVAAGDGHRLVLVAGEAGLGKTSLVAEAARVAFADGAIVLYGRCDEDLGIPYQPFREVLGHYLTHESPERLAALDPQLVAGLARLIPTLRRQLPHLPQSAPSDPDADRWILFSAIATLLAEISEDFAVMVVLDDIHWADRPSLQLLRHLSTSELGRVLIVATYRDNELSATHPLADAVARLRRENNVERMALSGLGSSEVGQFVESVSGNMLDEQGAELAQALYRDTDGNPFFVSEVLRHLVETGALNPGNQGPRASRVGPVDLGLPESLREVVGARVSRMGLRANAVLTAASVIGQEFDVRLLAAVCGEEEETILEVMEEGTRVALVAELPEPDRFRFTHALFRQTLYADLTALRQARLHRRVAESLEQLCGDDPGERVGELARHFLAASMPSDPMKAVHYARRAAQRALDSLAPDEAARWYSLALEALAGAHGNEAERAQLLAGLGEAQRQAGDPGYRQTLLDAAAMARPLHDTDTLVVAALANNRGFQGATGVVDTERVTVIEAALEAVGDSQPAIRARLLAHLALELTWDDDHTKRWALADEAVVLARSTGDQSTLLDVFIRRCGAQWDPARPEELLAQMREAESLAQELGDQVAKFWAARFRAVMALQIGELAEVVTCLETMRKLASEVGQPILRWVVAYSQSWLALLHGDTETAESSAEEALHLGIDTGQPDYVLLYVAQLAMIRWHQGKDGQLVELGDTLIADNPGVPAVRAHLGRILAEVGRTDDARALLDAEARGGFHHPLNPTYLQYLSTCAHLACLLGDKAIATELYERLAPWHGQLIFNTTTMHGSVAHYLGMLAAQLGHPDDAETHFAEAAVNHKRVQATFFIAWTELEWGRMLAVGGALSDKMSATEHLGSAKELAHRYGYKLVERRAAQLLARP